MPKNKQDVLKIAERFFSRLTDEEMEVGFGNQKTAKIKKIDLDSFFVTIGSGAPFTISKSEITRDGKTDFAQRNFEDLFDVLTVAGDILQTPIAEFQREQRLEEKRSEEQRVYEEMRVQLQKARQQDRVEKEMKIVLEDDHLGSAAATAMNVAEIVLGDDDFEMVEMPSTALSEEDDFEMVDRTPSPAPVAAAARQAQLPKTNVAGITTVS